MARVSVMRPRHITVLRHLSTTAIVRLTTVNLLCGPVSLPRAFVVNAMSLPAIVPPAVPTTSRK
jgi:hypothetical protein